MLAERHQFLQAYYSAAIRFSDDTEIKRSISLYSTTYCDDISAPIARCGDHKDGVTQVAENVSIHGTSYKRGMLVTVRRENETYVFGHHVAC